MIALLVIGLTPPGCAVTPTQGDIASPPPPAAMTIQRLDSLVRERGQSVKREGAVWQFRYEGVAVVCIADTKSDRMRLVSPIIALEKMSGLQLQRTMQANFHSALDARYAVRGGILYAAYIHPLSPLQDDQVRSGLFQVTNLVKSFGTTYQSRGLYFGRPEGAAKHTPHGPSTDI